LKIKVAEAIQDDVNKGIVRIDSALMHKLGIRPGDFLNITGERTTIAVVDRAYPGDIGLQIIRMDGLVRRNAKTGIGEQVTIRKAVVERAKKVIIAPAQKGIVIRTSSPALFKQGLLGRAVMKGDIVSLGGANRRRNAMESNPFFNDIFSMLDSNVSNFGFSDIKFIVADTAPKGGVIISDETQVVFNPEAVELKEEKVLEVTYEDIGGLGDEIKKIRELVELPLKHPEIFESLGIEPPKGVLLYGPPGTGKTMLAKAVANETASNFILINGPEIMSKFYGQSEANLRKKFEDAEKNAPSIIFIDEIDAIAPKREESYGEVERRVVAQLLSIMDGLKSRGKVVVIAATNLPDVLDPALRRPGRFDREIEIGVPDKVGRRKILGIHTRNMPLYTFMDGINEFKDQDPKIREALIELYNHSRNKDVFSSFQLEKRISKFLSDNPGKEVLFKEIDFNRLKDDIDTIRRSNPNLVSLHEFAESTHGFVGADLSALAKEAAMVVLRRVLEEINLSEDEPIPKELLDKLRITRMDFREAMKVVRPSGMREVYVEIPNVKWDDIGGMEDIKQELKEVVEWPLNNPGSFSKLGIKPPKGVLIYGPPGTGKTLVAKAVANESAANFILVKGPELLSKWVGESEKAVRKIFQKARQTSPTIIFFDEIDSMAPARGAGSSDSKATERVVNQLLTELDGVEEMNDLVVVASTNRPDIIDPALMRPGRFDRIVYTPVPDEKARAEIFKVHTKRMPIDFSSVAHKKEHMASEAEKPARKSPAAVQANATDQMKEKFYNELAAKTEGYAGADIESVCREAAMLALRKDMKVRILKMENFREALEKVQPSVTKEIEEAYKKFAESFRQAKGKQMKDESIRYFG
jgi:transitional endoplasmic reticulum ATPase